MPRTTPLTIVRRLIALAAAAALCGLAVPAAEAAQGFVPAVQVGGPTAPTQGDVATDANGDTIAVWSEGSPGGDAIVGWLKLNPASGNTEVWAAITLAGQGAFGAGTALSVGSESATGFDLGIGSAGHAVALWTTTAGSSPAANASALRYAT